jgi:hypothetical protein
MDGQRFDDLTRSLATSRRGVLRAIAASAAGGLLSVLAGAEATARQPSQPARPPRPPRPPRPSICRRRQDGDTCGACGTCQAGTCVADDARCPGCQICDPTSRTCVPVAEGESCGLCLSCQGGECRAVPDDEPCGGDCGYCLNGFCEPYGEGCEGECYGCDVGTFTCGPIREGFPCGGGDCGVCQDGSCEPDVSSCDLQCAFCDRDSLTCMPVPEGVRCGLGECGACEGGQCVPDNARCDPDCGLCLQQGNTFACVPAADGSDCGANGTCQGGRCLEQTTCPPGKLRCPTNPTFDFACCFDPNFPACETCQLGPGGIGNVCYSQIPYFTEFCARQGERIGVGLGILPGTCGGCCSLPGELCAGYACCSGGTCEYDPTTSNYRCP